MFKHMEVAPAPRIPADTGGVLGSKTSGDVPPFKSWHACD
jgi:hypothetical protein